MVFTLTAAMLVGTPLTASAAGLVDLYQIEDGWGTVTDNNDNSSTGTVTATGTYSTTLEDGQQEPVGIYLNNSNVELEYPDEGSLTAAIDWGTADGSVPANCQKLNDDMLKHLDWEVETTDIVALEGKFNGRSRATIKLHPKAAGTATVTVSLPGKFNFSASATVTVIRYADALEFQENNLKGEACVGNSINLNDYVNRYIIDGGIKKIAKTSDTLAFSLKLDENNANKNCATLKNGVLALKKEGKIKILAVGQKKGEKVGTGWLELNVEKGTNVKKITFKDGNKQEFLVNKGMTKAVTALIEKDGDGDCKNRITWTSKKTAIVEIKDTATNLKLDKSNTSAPESTVTLKAKAPGKAQIEAKASNGKKATLTVTVSANLTKITIEKTAVPEKLYSGQTIDLYASANQYFEKDGDMDFTDAGLKWIFDGTADEQKAAKKVASINAKGVLTIKPNLTYKDKGQDVTVEKIKVKAVNAKKIATNPAVAAGKLEDAKCGHAEFKLEQVSIDTITVTRNEIHASVARNTTTNKVKQDKKVADTVAVGAKPVTYTLTATGTKKDGTPLTAEEARAALGWISSNAKVAKASKSADNNGVIEAVKKGSANITINSATLNTKTGKYVAIKATFQEKVTAPTQTLTLKIKNKCIVAPKKQTVSITPVIEKGSTTKNNGKDIMWSATLNGEEFKAIDNKGKIKNYTFSEADLGKELVVTAWARGGASATIVLPIIQPTKKVKFTPSAKQTIANGEPLNVTTTIDIQGGASDQTPGKDNKVSKVTYTVNKEGIVRIRDLGEGKLEINPVTNGTVKITATTLDGKKTNLTVTVKDVKFANEFWMLEQ